MDDGGGRPRLLATSDCESCRPGLVSQPINTASSLAYVAAGGAVLIAADPRPARAGTRAVGWSLIAVGAGSVAYHGPGGAAGRWLHDASLLAMTGMIALSDVHHARGTSPSPAQVAVIGTAAAVATHPWTSGVAQAATAAVALGAEVHRHVTNDGDGGSGHDRAASDANGGHSNILAATLFATGLALHAAGRTGRPLCRPDSPIQAHAAWHVLSAAALWLRTRRRR